MAYLIAMRTLLTLSIALLALGCGDDLPTRADTGTGALDGGGSGRDGDIANWDSGVGGDGSVTTSCETRARWVYLVDSDRTLIRFEPDSLTFAEIGTLNCDMSSQPFSMAVDHNALAWVLYQNGNIYRANTIDARCNPTSFRANQAGFEVFGMGFVGREDDRENEQLFVAGGSNDGIGSGQARLATIDTDTFQLTPTGSMLPGWPELTGTGTEQLWGFFPDTTPPSASRLNPTTGAAEQTFPLNVIPGGSPRAWAFAFWGGRYYVFLQTDRDDSTNVYRLDPTTGDAELVLANTGRRIVGAGVSICAPTDLI